MEKTTHIGKTIAHYRKLKDMTQSELAQRLNLSMQAVSKWEQGQSCPDIMLLPEIADIFSISVDALFNRPEKRNIIYRFNPNVPWYDDDKIRIAIYSGRKLVDQSTYEFQIGENRIPFTFDYAKININGDCKFTATEIKPDKE